MEKMQDAELMEIALEEDIMEATFEKDDLVSGNVYGYFEPFKERVRVSAGRRILKIKGLPANLRSISIWMTESDGNGTGSHALGAIFRTHSVQINSADNIVRVEYEHNWGSKIYPGAQIMFTVK